MIPGLLGDLERVLMTPAATKNERKIAKKPALTVRMLKTANVIFKINDLDTWSEWGSWTSCSHSCGGYKSRTRYCIKGDCPVNNPGCPGESSQTVDCDHANQGRIHTKRFIISIATC